MNREELMKKLVLARVGNGTQTYNDVVLTLTKEETLELLKHIEKLEKENSELLIENERLDTRVVALEELCNINRKINDLTTKAVEENTKLKQAINILKDKIEFEDLGEMQSENVYRGYFNDCLDEEEVNSLKEVLKDDK